MSSKRHQRRKSCDGKVRYPSQEEAHTAMYSLKHDDHINGRHEFMSIYPCKFCGGWHIGHTRRYNPYLPKKERFAKI